MPTISQWPGKHTPPTFEQKYKLPRASNEHTHGVAHALHVADDGGNDTRVCGQHGFVAIARENGATGVRQDEYMLIVLEKGRVLREYKQITNANLSTSSNGLITTPIAIERVDPSARHNDTHALLC